MGADACDWSVKTMNEIDRIKGVERKENTVGERRLEEMRGL